MPETNKKTSSDAGKDDYLETLERVKKQYQQYVEVSRLYELPLQKAEEEIHYQPTSPENPLTMNTFRVKSFRPSSPIAPQQPPSNPS